MTTSVQRRHGVQNQRSLSPKHSAVSPTHQYDPYAPQLGYLSENIHRLLTERECAIFDRGMTSDKLYKVDFKVQYNVKISNDSIKVKMILN